MPEIKEIKPIKEVNLVATDDFADLQLDQAALIAAIKAKLQNPHLVNQQEQLKALEVVPNAALRERAIQILGGF